MKINLTDKLLVLIAFDSEHLKDTFDFLEVENLDFECLGDP